MADHGAMQGAKRLLIFLRYPSPGRVKTRLAAQLGARAAAEVYRACAELTLARLEPFRRHATLCVDPPQALGRVRRWLGSDWTLRAQQGVSLGDRLAQATTSAFAHGAVRVVVVGTDSPWLRLGDVEDAFRALGRAELVVGPAMDGGYYLIGLSRSLPEVFDRVAWGTDRVYEQTLARAHGLGVRVGRLRRGYDVDRLEDVLRLVADERTQGGSRTLAQTIEACLQRLPGASPRTMSAAAGAVSCRRQPNGRTGRHD